MLNVRVKPAVLIISSLMDCEILVAVSIEYCKNSNFDKSKHCTHTQYVLMECEMGLVYGFKLCGTMTFV